MHLSWEDAREVCAGDADGQARRGRSSLPQHWRDYVPAKLIGQGGFGLVYLCNRRHQPLAQPEADSLRSPGPSPSRATSSPSSSPSPSQVAVKAIPLSNLSDDEILLAMTEASLLKQLEHGNILRFIDCFMDEEEQQLCLVTEFVAGGDLAALIRLHTGAHGEGTRAGVMGGSRRRMAREEQGAAEGWPATPPSTCGGGGDASWELADDNVSGRGAGGGAGTNFDCVCAPTHPALPSVHLWSRKRGRGSQGGEEAEAEAEAGESSRVGDWATSSDAINAAAVARERDDNLWRSGAAWQGCGQGALTFACSGTWGSGGGDASYMPTTPLAASAAGALPSHHSVSSAQPHAAVVAPAAPTRASALPLAGSANAAVEGDWLESFLVIDIVRQCLDGLAYLHSLSILHRDIKPANLYLDKDSGTVKIGDFGVSKLLSPTDPFAETFIGTPFYLSPELCLGEPYSFAADVWALGVLTYELYCLRLPFSADNVLGQIHVITEGVFDRQRLMQRHAFSQERLAELKKRYGNDFEQKEALMHSLVVKLVEQMLTPDPEQRPSAEQLLMHVFGMPPSFLLRPGTAGISPSSSRPASRSIAAAAGRLAAQREGSRGAEQWSRVGSPQRLGFRESAVEEASDLPPQQQQRSEGVLTSEAVAGTPPGERVTRTSGTWREAVNGVPGPASTLERRVDAQMEVIYAHLPPSRRRGLVATAAAAAVEHPEMEASDEAAEETSSAQGTDASASRPWTRWQQRRESSLLASLPPRRQELSSSCAAGPVVVQRRSVDDRLSGHETRREWKAADRLISVPIMASVEPAVDGAAVPDVLSFPEEGDDSGSGERAATPHSEVSRHLLTRVVAARVDEASRGGLSAASTPNAAAMTPSARAQCHPTPPLSPPASPSASATRRHPCRQPDSAPSSPPHQHRQEEGDADADADAEGDDRLDNAIRSATRGEINDLIARVPWLLNAEAFSALTLHEGSDGVVMVERGGGGGGSPGKATPRHATAASLREGGGELVSFEARGAGPRARRRASASVSQSAEDGTTAWATPPPPALTALPSIDQPAASRSGAATHSLEVVEEGREAEGDASRRLSALRLPRVDSAVGSRLRPVSAHCSASQAASPLLADGAAHTALAERASAPTVTAAPRPLTPPPQTPSLAAASAVPSLVSTLALLNPASPATADITQVLPLSATGDTTEATPGVVARTSDPGRCEGLSAAELERLIRAKIWANQQRRHAQWRRQRTQAEQREAARANVRERLHALFTQTYEDALATAMAASASSSQRLQRREDRTASAGSGSLASPGTPYLSTVAFKGSAREDADSKDADAEGVAGRALCRATSAPEPQSLSVSRPVSTLRGGDGGGGGGGHAAALSTMRSFWSPPGCSTLSPSPWASPHKPGSDGAHAGIAVGAGASTMTPSPPVDWLDRTARSAMAESLARQRMAERRHHGVSTARTDCSAHTARSLASNDDQGSRRAEVLTSSSASSWLDAVLRSAAARDLAAKADKDREELVLGMPGSATAPRALIAPVMRLAHQPLSAPPRSAADVLRGGVPPSDDEDAILDTRAAMDLARAAADAAAIEARRQAFKTAAHRPRRVLIAPPWVPPRADKEFPDLWESSSVEDVPEGLEGTEAGPTRTCRGRPRPRPAALLEEPRWRWSAPPSSDGSDTDTATDSTTDTTTTTANGGGSESDVESEDGEEDEEDGQATEETSDSDRQSQDEEGNRPAMSPPAVAAVQQRASAPCLAAPRTLPSTPVTSADREGDASSASSSVATSSDEESAPSSSTSEEESTEEEDESTEETDEEEEDTSYMYVALRELLSRRRYFDYNIPITLEIVSALPGASGLPAPQSPETPSTSPQLQEHHDITPDASAGRAFTASGPSQRRRSLSREVAPATRHSRSTRTTPVRTATPTRGRARGSPPAERPQVRRGPQSRRVSLGPATKPPGRDTRDPLSIEGVGMSAGMARVAEGQGSKSKPSRPPLVRKPAEEDRPSPTTSPSPVEKGEERAEPSLAPPPAPRYAYGDRELPITIALRPLHDRTRLSGVLWRLRTALQQRKLDGVLGAALAQDREGDLAHRHTSPQSGRMELSSLPLFYCTTSAAAFEDDQGKGKRGTSSTTAAAGVAAPAQGTKTGPSGDRTSHAPALTPSCNDCPRLTALPLRTDAAWSRVLQHWLALGPLQQPFLRLYLVAPPESLTLMPEE